MPSPRLPDELARQALELREKYGSTTEAARVLGVPRSTLDSRIGVAIARGMAGTRPILPGYYLSKETAVLDKNGEVVREFVQQKPEPGGEFEPPEGHQVKGVSALIDGDGRTVLQWIKTREGSIDPVELAQRLKEVFEGITPREPTPEPTAPLSDDLLCLFPCNDWHIGQYVWHEEASESWDLGIAERVLLSAVDQTMGQTPACGVAIVLGGGDLLHVDNKNNLTPRSGNPLDVDGRYPKVLEAGCRMMVASIDAALRRHGKVVVRILPGNHDEHACFAVSYFLKAWFRNEPRVEVDTDPSLFFWYTFGKVLIGSTHGHTVKIKDMPQIMAHRRAADWGASLHRYVHGFHLHHNERTHVREGGGVISEIHQAPVPQDAWHWGAGFLSGRSMQAITYHRELGEIGRVRTAILDAGLDGDTPPDDPAS